MKYLNTFLITVYVVLIILLLLNNCDRPKERVCNEPVRNEEEDIISAGEVVDPEEVEELPTCEEGCEEVNNSQKMYIERPFNMGVAAGEFILNWETFSVPDQILVYNCLPRQIPDNTPIFDTGMVATDQKQATRISFNNGPVITIVGKTGSPSGSSWWYCLQCLN